MAIQRWKGSSETDCQFMELKRFARQTTTNRIERNTTNRNESLTITARYASWILLLCWQYSHTTVQMVWLDEENKICVFLIKYVTYL